jgi:hypothetical protein
MCADDVSQSIHEAAASYAVAGTSWPDEPLIVERVGRPVAVIISLEEYRRFAAWRAERSARRAWVLEHDPRQRMTTNEWRAQFAALDRFAAHFADVSDEELAAEQAEATRAVRAKQAESTAKEQ